MCIGRAGWPKFCLLRSERNASIGTRTISLQFTNESRCYVYLLQKIFLFIEIVFHVVAVPLYPEWFTSWLQFTDMAILSSGWESLSDGVCIPIYLYHWGLDSHMNGGHRWNSVGVFDCILWNGREFCLLYRNVWTVLLWCLNGSNIALLETWLRYSFMRSLYSVSCVKKHEGDSCACSKWRNSTNEGNHPYP